MESSKLKNMVVLKNLPSNLIDEAIIVLKSNKRVKKLQKIEQNKQIQYDENTKKDKEYILKEAEMIINNYISKVENKDKKNMELKNELNKDGLSEFVNKKDVALTPEEIQALAAAKAIELREKDKKLAEEREAEAKKEERGKKIRKWWIQGYMES